MTMKTILSRIALGTALLLTCNSFAAAADGITAGATVRDGTVHITVRGVWEESGGGDVSFSVTDAESDVSEKFAPIYFEQKTAPEDGTLDFAFAVNPKFIGTADSGAYRYRIALRDEQTRDGNIEIVNTDKLSEVFAKFRAAEDADAVEKAFDGFNPCLNVDTFAGMSKKPWYEFLLGSKDDAADIDGFFTLMKKSAVAESFNQSLGGGEIPYADEFLDEKTYNIYERDLSQTGSDNVTNAVKAKDFRTVDAFAAALAKEVVTAAIINPKEADTDKSLAILNENVQLLGIDAPAAAYQKEIMRNLLRAAPTNYADFCTRYKEICAQLGGGSAAPSGGSGGGGGSSSGGYNAGTATPVLPGGTQRTDYFSDMDGYEWALDAVNALTAAGVINGKSGDMKLFAPSDTVTREEFVKMIMLALKLSDGSVATGADYADVDVQSWYAPYISAAVSYGIINGVSPERFGVGEPITRQDMAAIVFRAMKCAYDIRDIEQTAAPFGDHIDEYALAAVGYLSSKGIISGYPDGTFGAERTADRAEAAQIIYNVVRQCVLDSRLPKVNAG